MNNKSPSFNTGTVVSSTDDNVKFTVNKSGVAGSSFKDFKTSECHEKITELDWARPKADFYKYIHDLKMEENEGAGQFNQVITSCLSPINLLRYFYSFRDTNRHLRIRSSSTCFQRQLDMRNMVKSYTILNTVLKTALATHTWRIFISYDLKPANIFLSSFNGKSLVFKKVGFGICFGDQSVMSYDGSAHDSAPKRISGQYDCKGDVFSLAMTLLELSTFSQDSPDYYTNFLDRILQDLHSDAKNWTEAFEPLHRKALIRFYIILSSLYNDFNAKLNATEVREELCKLADSDDCCDLTGIESSMDSAQKIQPLHVDEPLENRRKNHVVQDFGLNTDKLFEFYKTEELDEVNVQDRVFFSNVLMLIFSQKVELCSLEEIEEVSGISLTSNPMGKSAHLCYPCVYFFMYHHCSDKSILSNLWYGVKALAECGFDCSEPYRLFLDVKQSNVDVSHLNFFMQDFSKTVISLPDCKGKYILQRLHKLLQAVADETYVADAKTFEIPRLLKVTLQLARMHSESEELKPLIKLLSCQTNLVQKLDLRICNADAANFGNLRSECMELTDLFAAIFASNCSLHLTTDGLSLEFLLEYMKSAAKKVEKTQVVVESLDIIEDQAMLSEGFYQLLQTTDFEVHRTNVTAGPIFQPVVTCKGTSTALLSNTKMALRELKLSGFSISEEASGQWITHLHKLVLQDCTIMSKSFSDSLKTNRMLTELILTKSGLRSGDAVLLAKSLETNNTLLVLDLSGNRIGDEGASAIYKALQKNSTLCDLDISNNRFQVLIEKTSDQYELNNKTNIGGKLNLKSLNICGNRLCQFGTIADHLRFNQTVRKLGLGNTGISDKDIPGIEAIVIGNRRIKELNLRENRLSSAVLIVLLKALFGNGQPAALEILDLSWNLTLFDVLPDHIPGTYGLHTLLLEGNRIDDNMISVLVGEAHFVQFVSILSLGVNEISDKGMEDICEMLEGNTSLIELYLHANRGITDASYGPLVNALKSNSTLEVLDLTGTNIGIQCSFDLKVKFREKYILCSPDFGTGEHESLQLNLHELFNV